MDDWISLEKKPISIGKCSRGFIIDKDKLHLKSDVWYVIKIIPKNNFYDEILEFKNKIKTLLGGKI